MVAFPVKPTAAWLHRQIRQVESCKASPLQFIFEYSHATIRTGSAVFYGYNNISQFSTDSNVISIIYLSNMTPLFQIGLILTSHGNQKYHRQMRETLTENQRDSGCFMANVPLSLSVPNKINTTKATAKCSRNRNKRTKKRVLMSFAHRTLPSST